MRNFVRVVASIACSLVFVSNALALDFENDPGISEKDLRASIARSTRLSTAQIDSIIIALKKQLNTGENEILPIRGYLYAHGMNGALLVDHDVWSFDATLKAPGGEELIDISNLFLCDFHNGGIKFEIAYKWMFTFIPRGVHATELDGGIYGRGIGVVFDPLLGFEGSWMPAQNRPHDLIHIALKLGVGAGVVFPKMEFKMRPINVSL